MIRLQSGPGDGLHLAIPEPTPPDRITFDPEAITVTPVSPRARPKSPTYRRTHEEAGDWYYRYEGE